MKTIFLSVLILYSVFSSYSQNTDSLAEKFTQKMCLCFGELNNYEEYKNKLNNCYDKAQTEITDEKDYEVIMILVNSEKKNALNKKIEILLVTECESVKNVVQQDVLEGSSNNPFPTNFDFTDLKKLKRKPQKSDGEIMAFNATIIDIKQGPQNKLYYKVKLGDEEMWVGSLVNSDYEILGAELRILGYVSLINQNDPIKKINNSGFHILALGVLDLASKQLAIFPAASKQLKEWRNGKVPVGQ
jgi:hypothetical protein